VSYFETTWKDFPETVEVEEQALLPTTAEGRWLFQVETREGGNGLILRFESHELLNTRHWEKTWTEF